MVISFLFLFCSFVASQTILLPPNSFSKISYPQDTYKISWSSLSMEPSNIQLISTKDYMSYTIDKSLPVDNLNSHCMNVTLCEFAYELFEPSLIVIINDSSNPITLLYVIDAYSSFISGDFVLLFIVVLIFMCFCCFISTLIIYCK